MPPAPSARRSHAAHRGSSLALRLAAVTALLLAAWIVVTVVVEAREPSASNTASQIPSLPRNLFNP
jgi:hypothetical protein